MEMDKVIFVGGSSTGSYYNGNLVHHGSRVGATDNTQVITSYLEH